VLLIKTIEDNFLNLFDPTVVETIIGFTRKTIITIVILNHTYLLHFIFFIQLSRKWNDAFNIELTYVVAKGDMTTFI